MVVMTLELAPPRLRGWLTRWLTEVAPGVYVGDVNALVRDLLWDAVVDASAETGRAIQVYSTNNEQGYAIPLAARADRQRLAHRQEFRISLDVRHQREHLRRRMGDGSGGFETWHRRRATR